jgi:hypothetical protein
MNLQDAWTWADAAAKQADAHLIEMNALRAQLRAAVDALRSVRSLNGWTPDGISAAEVRAAEIRAVAIVAAYDAQHPEGK